MQDLISNLGIQVKDSMGERRQDILDHIRAMTGENRGGEIPETALSEEFSGIPASKLDARRITDFVNDKLERELYGIAMQSEANAHCFFDAPFLYRPNIFRSYDPYSVLSNPSGILSLSDFLALCPTLPISGYGRIAAYLALLDDGMISSDFQVAGTCMYQVCSVEDRVQFFLPQKLALFVPALAFAERNAPLLNLSARESVLRFVRKYLNYDGERREIAAGLFDLRLCIQDYLDIMEQAAQAFAGWDFGTLTMQSDSACAKAQEDFLAQAREFIETREVF